MELAAFISLTKPTITLLIGEVEAARVDVEIGDKLHEDHVGGRQHGRVWGTIAAELPYQRVVHAESVIYLNMSKG